MRHRTRIVLTRLATGRTPLETLSRVVDATSKGASGLLVSFASVFSTLLDTILNDHHPVSTLFPQHRYHVQRLDTSSDVQLCGVLSSMVPSARVSLRIRYWVDERCCVFGGRGLTLLALESASSHPSSLSLHVLVAVCPSSRQYHPDALPWISCRLSCFNGRLLTPAFSPGLRSMKA